MPRRAKAVYQPWNWATCTQREARRISRHARPTLAPATSYQAPPTGPGSALQAAGMQPPPTPLRPAMEVSPRAAPATPDEGHACNATPAPMRTMHAWQPAVSPRPVQQGYAPQPHVGPGKTRPRTRQTAAHHQPQGAKQCHGWVKQPRASPAPTPAPSTHRPPSHCSHSAAGSAARPLGKPLTRGGTLGKGLW